MTGRFTILRNTYSGCVPGGFFCILDRSAYGSGVEIGFLGVIFFFLCGLQSNNESGLNAEARSKQKTMGLFSTSI